jgi:uncharacterized protein (DUF983 family)
VPPLPAAIWRGLRCRCPACGKTPAFQGYLTVVPRCPLCGAPLGSARADDAPPYFTVLLVGHLVVPLVFLVDLNYAPPIWAMAAIFLPLTLVLTLLLLRPVKGATVGLMLKLDLMKSADDW